MSEQLTIGTYPWPTIDARDLLRRVAEAEARVVELAKVGTELADGVIEAMPQVTDVANVAAELHHVLNEAGIEPASTVEGVKGRDILGRVKRMAAALKTSREQWALAGDALQGISPSEAAFGLIAWLTTREKTLTLGFEHDCAEAAKLAGVFCIANKLGKVRDDYSDRLADPTPAQEAAWDKLDDGIEEGASQQAPEPTPNGM